MGRDGPRRAAWQLHHRVAGNSPQALGVHGVQAVTQLVIMARDRLPWRSRVNATEVRPARTLTSFGLAPASIHSATAMCRRSWGRGGASPAARTAGSHTLTRRLDGRSTRPAKQSQEGRTMAEASVSFAGNLAAAVRRHARDPHRPLITLGFSLG